MLHGAACYIKNLQNWVILDKCKCWDSYSSTMVSILGQLITIWLYGQEIPLIDFQWFSWDHGHRLLRNVNGNFRIRLIGGIDSIYKAYFLGPCKKISPQNMAKHMVLTYLQSNLGSWRSPIDFGKNRGAGLDISIVTGDYVYQRSHHVAGGTMADDFSGSNWWKKNCTDRSTLWVRVLEYESHS